MLKYEELTHNIIGCAMKVHSVLGNGFQEVIYQKCLAIEIDKNKIQYLKEMEMPIYYDGIEVGKRRVDFFVSNEILLELKAVIKLEEAHLSQTFNYLEAYKKDIALLINFGGRSLEFKRLHNKKLRNQVKN